MINIPGYQILAKIYEGGKSIVYQGRQEQDNLPVILKVLKVDYPTAEQLTRYQNEYEITQNLNLESVVKAYSLQKYHNTLVMVLEDFGGESLRMLMGSQKLTLLGFLTLGIRIAESLGEIHAANIIHKDINPSNIVVNPATKQAKLIDFSIATVLTRENPTIKNPAVLEGTLAYMSPEQTGRMNRALDYRTDFYSLGVTFYELLTQQLPFDTTDAMELVHSHIAKQPVPPHQINPEIPIAVSNIVMKLLAKTAEERYQSAWGIVADLENCLTQLQSSGFISDFPLGRQDISDKFQIPQKLYGREQEIETLMAAFERVSQGHTEMMLVLGYSGVGKSALVQEIYKPITRKRGYFISGKFDQFQRNIPYSAIVNAFSELVRQLLTESGDRLESWRERLLAAFGPNGKIIIDVIPEVELIVGPQPPVPELGPTESQNRFNLVFQNFIRVFCQREHPLVIFLDDLQWADSATLKLMELMMTDSQEPYLFLIGAYRDNEVNPTHPLMMTLDALSNQGAIINEITLAPLNLDQITQLIAETLHSDPGKVKPLASLIVNKTGGNPFFVNEFLKTLYQEDLLTFTSPHSGSIGGWQWDISNIEALGITENVVDLMIGKLKRLPEPTQKVISLAACLGNQFDLNTLSLIHEKESSKTFQDLLPAIETGLILPSSDLETSSEELIKYPLLILNYKFLHDRVQQAAYALIDDSHKKAVHLRIGRLLLANTPVQYRLERIFELVDHLNVGRSLITDEQEIIELAVLNLEAARKAKDATAYFAARQYLTSGMDGLNKDIWDSHYELAFALYKERSEIEYLNGNFEQSEEFVYLTLKDARSALEKAEVYNLLLVQYTLRAKYEDAVMAGKKALALLGIDLPAEDLQTVISAEFAEVKENLGSKEISSLIAEPEMTISEKRVALKLLNNFLPSVYLIDSTLWTISILKSVNLSLKYGNAPESSVFYANYGILLNAVYGEYKSAYDFGLLAFKLSEKWNNLELKGKICNAFANGLNYWFKHLKESIYINNEGYQASLDSGDLQYAGYILINKSTNSFMQGKSISQVLAELPSYLQFSQKTKNRMATDTILGLQLTLLNLSQITNEKLNFETDEISESQYLESCRQHQNFYSLCFYNLLKAQVFYLYGNLSEALNCILYAQKQLHFITGKFLVTEHNFYHSLILAALYQEAKLDKQKEYLKQLEANQKQMQVWAENGPANFSHKYLLVAAEIARISGRGEEAVELYNRAIELARENEFIQNEAIANELVAKFWLSKRKQKYAEIHMREAYYGYQRWGATRKVKDLEEFFPQLITKAPEANRLTDTRNADIYTSTGNSLTVLDLSTVMKASLAISSEIVLDKLLASLMTISIENAGAESGFLILPKEGKLVIAAEASVAKPEVVVQESTLIECSEDLPVTVINYVERTRSPVVLNNALDEGRFTTDPYIVRRQLKSLLCTPIINQGKLISILYLENNLTAGAFTPDRLAVLKVLSSQMAISLDNALLYASMEQQVAARTQELKEKNQRLSQTLQELQRTQAQLIQTEKMSSLGQMVAGIAHEINNPISFIYGNLVHAREYVQDLLSLIQVYQQEYSKPTSKVQEAMSDIDLNFLVEDMQKLFDSMRVGADRIRDIVLSLRNFARLDEASMKPVDIHTGIDSTLMLLQPRLRPEGGRPGIEVIKDYGELSQITCYASQLNQVLMNILSNACDALDEVRKQGESDKTLTITIRTESTDRNSAIIRITDNGPGMPEEVLRRIFDPFFTTKPVGSGTGLGLSISYQIVVERHGGQLACVSSPGEGTEFLIEIPSQAIARGRS